MLNLDNIINQAILSTWMKKHKIKFSVASDGLEAVRKWEGGGFHLVLVSGILPV
jgi:osomolarity two-component system response regulator SSK1